MSGILWLILASALLIVILAICMAAESLISYLRIRSETKQDDQCVQDSVHPPPSVQASTRDNE